LPPDPNSRLMAITNFGFSIVVDIEGTKVQK